MAGKTFPGIGELEGEPLDPADVADTGATPAPSSSQFYSGPTVVDDAKVEEGLQKLRSLDAPLTAVSGTVDTAHEILESGGNQIEAVLQPSVLQPSLLQPSLLQPSGLQPSMKDGGRETFIGHSVRALPPAAEPVEKPYDDRMRGTLYGHMLHLPELKLPAPEEPSSRELTIVDRSAPTHQAIEVYQPDADRRAAAGIPHEAEAFPRSDRYRSVPIEIDAGSDHKLWFRVGIAAAAIAAIVGAAIIWLRANPDEPELPARSAAVATPAPPPVIVPAPAAPQPPAAAPAAVVPGAAPGHPDTAAAAKPGHEAVRPSSERARALSVRPATTPPPAPLARPDHHRSSSGGATSAGDGPARPRATRRSAAEDDPDGTLAPSIE